MWLFDYLNIDAGLKFHSEFVLIDSDLFNQPPKQGFVILDQGNWLLLQKCAHVGNPFFQFIPTEVLDLSLKSFGTGVITAIEGTSIAVEFDKVGLKKMGYEFCMNNKLLEFI